MPHTPIYRYITPTGKHIECWVQEDCGMVQGPTEVWHKVKCRPIGFNNCPVMILDRKTLTEIVE